MTPEQYERAHRLFHDVREAPPAERAARVRAAAVEPDVAAAVEAMLAHDHDDGDDDGDDALAAAVPFDLSDVVTPDVAMPDVAMPDHVGPFRITGRLGEGGMGVVYRAEQSTPRRDVALKLVRPGALSPVMRRRFEHEVDVLGRLSHPGIAQVFEAGTVVGPGGIEQPYFAMELVDGRELLAHARTLAPRDRVALLIEIGRTVQHAHQKGIIHRDLKPANILVTDHGTPKVLDFGVARGGGDQATLTVTGQLVGTIGYMSPEQARGDHGAVDVRSDVHALGVIAYEVLSGRPAFDLNGLDLLEAARRVDADEPAPLGATDTRLGGDLETIVAKAMSKEPALRYASAADLADDLQRHLDDEPVVARAPSAAYQIRKYARRNRRVIGTLAVVAASLLVTTVVSTAFGLRERSARDDAQRQAEIAAAVSGFLADDILGAAAPENEPDRDITLRAVLDRVAGTIDTRFPDAPEVRARLHTAVGDAYRGLAAHEPAEAHLRTAVTDWERLGGPRDRAALHARHLLAMVMENQSRYDEAIALDVVTLERRRTAFGNADEDTIRSMVTLGDLYADVGRLDDAAPLFDEALALARTNLGPHHSLTLTSLHNLASLHYHAGRLDDAIESQLAVLAIQRETLGNEHPNTMTSLNNLGAFYRAAGRYDEAWPFIDEAVALFRSVLGPEHTDTLIVQGGAALCLFDLERYAEAERMYLDTLEVQRRIVGDDHPQTARTRANLGLMYMDTDRAEDAEPMLVESLRIRRDHLGADHLTSRTTAYNLASLYVRSERAADALTLFADTVERSRRVAADHWLTGVHLTGYGDCLAEVGRPAEAETTLLEAHAFLTRHLGADHARTRKVAERLAHWYAAWDRPDDAARWREDGGG